MVEPHYRLPFLSWLPHGPLADRYVRASGRADHYYERFRTPARPAPARSTAFDIWDYTLPVLTDPVAFNAGDVVPGAVARVPARALPLALPLVPTYIWVGFRTPHAPAGPALATGPRHL